MKKRIISIILAALLMLCSLPLSVLAGEIARAIPDNSLPAVTVESLYSYDGKISSEYRALPDDEGYFYLDISLTKAPETGENVVVYYRTVDDTAVAEWGDYEGVGAYAEERVTLSKSNGYTARVIIKSKMLDYAFILDEDGNPSEKRIFSRRFFFEITRVEGDAKIYTPASSVDKKRSSLYCYLKAEDYYYQTYTAQMNSNLEDRLEYLRELFISASDNYYDVVSAYFNEVIVPLLTPSNYGIKSTALYYTLENAINTPQIKYQGSHSDYLNLKFNDDFKSYTSLDWCDLGISMYGTITRDYWDSDGDATFTLYYNYGGKKMPAMTLYLEGEFDDSTFFGWEHAFEYAIEGNESDEREDHIADNFIGFTLYDNNGKVAYEVKMDDSRSTIAQMNLCAALKDAILDGYAFKQVATDLSNDMNTERYYLKLPSNFVYADSYYYEFVSDSTSKKEIRWIENTSLSFAVTCDDRAMIARDEGGNQMVTTNINSLKEGDLLKMAIRFDRPVYFTGRRDQSYITAKINGIYEVKLTIKSPIGSTFEGDNYYYACDTLVFEGKLPDEVKDIKISSLRDIKFEDGSGTESGGIKTFISNGNILGKTISDIYGYEKDLRTPFAKVSVSSTESWTKSRPFDVYVYAAGTSSRFNDYVTVYYHWSNSKELPETYSSKVVFHTESDGQAFKTIIGTGNGEMYLHIKAVSSYGKTSISDSVTGTYNPGDTSAVYTPFGPFKFDNAAPELSADDITIGGSLKDREISLVLPDDAGGSGLQYMSLYYIAKDSENGEGTLLKRFTPDYFSGNPATLKYTISHRDVGVGVDVDGNDVLERREVEFYWVIADNLGNTSEKTARFKMVFDTNDYLESEITSAGPYDFSAHIGNAQFESTTETIDELTFIYNYELNEGKTVNVYSGSKRVYYGFGFRIDASQFGGNDNGVYGANIYYKGKQISNYTIEKKGDFYVVWFNEPMESGRYDIQLTRTEGESVRVSLTYSVYATNGEKDTTETGSKVEAGTLLNNSVYQLSDVYPYFYYKDSAGNRQQEYYNGIKKPATFSSYEKAKEYVYYNELSDLYLIELNDTLASALNSGTTGYLIAKGETVTPRAGQYWIRYKSESWTPTSGDSAWVYYYYGMSNELTEGALSLNLQNALNTVSNRITGYGKAVILTDTSLFLGNASGDRLLDEYGMPHLLDGQVHNLEEFSGQTKCGNKWSIQVYYSGDRNIYKGGTYTGEEYIEYPIIGNFALPADSLFQYMTYDEYGSGAEWRTLNIENGKTFVSVFTSSGIYYIREMSRDGVAIYAIYVDKEAPKVSFSNKDENGNFAEIPIDGVEILDIRTKELFIGSISSTEYDRLSYVAVYKVSNLSLVAIYMAEELDGAPIKLEDGNYYIVVSDRSGNHYTVTAKVSNSDLDCQIKETSDKFIKLTCNRKNDQIIIYEVYLNGELVTSTYAAEQTFDKAGFYSIYIQDIYGNVYSEQYKFTRNYPTVTWKYLGTDGKYHAYAPETASTDGFVMNFVSDGKYKISTSVRTRFSFSENYEFEFVGIAPEYTKTVGTETVVTIAEGQAFTLKVYYKNHSDCYTIYSGVVDVTPPTVSVSTEKDVLANGEYSLFEQWAAQGNVGDIIKMNEIYYTLSEKGRVTVLNGGIVSSDIIKINVSDANELALVEVYHDGALIKKQDTTSGFSQIIVSRWGNYRIVAKDSLGNVSEFTFTNGMPDDLDYFVDGNKIELELHSHLNFVNVGGKHVYSKVNYGNSEFKLDIKKNADVFISVGVSGNETEIYGFRIEDGCIYPLTYTITLDKNGEKTVELQMGEAIFGVNDAGFKYKNEYLLNEGGSHAIYASINADMVASIKVYAPDSATKVASVNARVEIDGNDTMFVSAEISKKRSEITFNDPNGEVISGGQGITDIKANSGFTVDESFFGGERVESVRLYYSILNDLDPDALTGRTDIYAEGGVYTEEGFYLLVVENRYGNREVYRIGISKTFGITSSVTFGDGHKIYYSKDYDNTLYSNNEIILDILNDDVKYAVTLYGAVYTGFKAVHENGIICLVFSEGGTYEVTLTDSYGNVITKQLVINKSTYTVDDGLLTGFNEKALKRDEGYTNRKISVNKAVLDREGIYYLAIKYGETLNVLYDAFGEEPVEIDEQKLFEAIGNMGDGTYTVICRNRYGAVVTKEIHYRGTPTLELERTIRSKSESEIYDLNYALLLGFWSNNTLTFRTDAGMYIFTVNGNVTECPRTLVFETAGDYGSSEYDITYIDEYGFEYSFKAYLVRKSVNASLSAGITVTEIDGVLNTQNDISITFDENAYVTYTRNNGEAIIYRQGDVLKKDGTYRFTITDYAGNATTLTIRKDTAVEFSFVESGTGAAIQSGGVVNSSKVSFNILNRDSAYIEKVLKNGVVQADFNGTKFTEDGKWELILSDKLGNKAYFCFYIITASKNGFAYTTPYEYRITEMWYDSGDGIKVSYLNFVNHDEYTSNFEFIENGKYTVVMTSEVTGASSTFEFTVNTLAPDVSLVGCNPGETTINDVTITGYKIGDRIKVYKTTDKGKVLVEEVEVLSSSTRIPTISEGGKYQIVVESEAGVSTELEFVRKHVMNTAGSVFVMMMIGFAIVGLFTGLIYRNKSKTDD